MRIAITFRDGQEALMDTKHVDLDLRKEEFLANNKLLNLKEVAKLEFFDDDKEQLGFNSYNKPMRIVNAEQYM